jgi:hypothetical protein
MKERPILFSAPMVRALLAGTKMQTRRVVKHRWPFLWQEPYYPTGKVLSELPNQPGAWMEFRHRRQDEADYEGSPASTLVPCPYGQPGERLWVRERFAPRDGITLINKQRSEIFYWADDEGKYWSDGPWKPSIHMPRWASRITLEITDVRVERLKSISREDAAAEGIDTDGEVFEEGGRYESAGGIPAEVWTYARLWESINGPGSWEANPWVWCVSFKQITPT